MSPHPSKVGILLINLGTPDGTGYFAVRRYLKEFLSDRRIVNLNPFLWKIILHCFILPRRPFVTGRKYQLIWDETKDGSPLRFFTRRQAELLQQRFSGEKIKIDWAMRYGAPNIAQKIKALQVKGCQRIILFPLYPQYSATTRASALDAVCHHFLKLTNQPATLTIPSFAGDEDYIAALATRLKRALNSLTFTPEKILLSFHGIPRKMAVKDYRYPTDCTLTAQKLRQAMNMNESQLLLTYQSRFGGGEWLKPYTIDVIEDLARTGTKHLAIMAPGFFSDCLETLDELGREIKEIFLKAGGENFALIPCLNDSQEGIDLLEKLIRKAKDGF